MAMYNFGSNTISDSQFSVQMQLQNGGAWAFDFQELVQLNEILCAMRRTRSSGDYKLWRSNGSRVIEVTDGPVGYIFLNEAGNEGHFLSAEVSDLIAAIEQIIPPVVTEAPFNGHKLRLYKRPRVLRLYALCLEGYHEGDGNWVFDEAEIRQYESILGRYPPIGQITRSQGRQMVDVSFFEFTLRENSRTSRFFFSQLRDAIQLMRTL